MNPLAILLVALGSAVGGVARHLGTLAGIWWLGASIGATVATIIINIVGSFAIGLTAGLTEQGGLARHFIAVGVLGGFTTFSTFSLQTLLLLQEKRILAASLNVALSVALCLVGVWAGWSVAQVLRRPAG